MAHQTTTIPSVQNGLLRAIFGAILFGYGSARIFHLDKSPVLMLTRIEHELTENWVVVLQDGQ